MNKKGIAMLLATTLAVTAFAGCSSKASVQKTSKPVKIVLYTGKVETVDLMNQIIADFNKQNPGITVEQQFEKDASNGIKVKFASGDVPDITTVVTQDYIDQNKYLDLSNETWWSRVQPSIKEMCTDVKSGKQYEIASNMILMVHYLLILRMDIWSGKAAMLQLQLLKY